MVRHGESLANAIKMHSGWADVPLTEKGIADAYVAKETLRDIEFDKVYSSDTLRARRTREIAKPDAVPTLTPLLRERGTGDLTFQYVDDAIKQYGDLYLNARENGDYSMFGGESYLDQVERVKKFLKIVEKDDCEKIGVFCHEGTINCVYHIITNRDHWEWITCKNGGVCIFEYKDGVWSLKEWGI